MIRDVFKNFGVVLSAVLLLFLLYNVLYGRTGFIAMGVLQDKLKTKQKVLNSIREKRFAKEHEVSLLKSDNLDIDLLEEQSRILFNYKYSDEIQVLN